MILGVGGLGAGAGLGARSFSLSTIRMRSLTSGELDREGTNRTGAGPRLDSLTTRRNCTCSSRLWPGLTLLVRWTMCWRTRTGLGDLWRGRSTVSTSLALRTIWPASDRLPSSRRKAGRRSRSCSRSRSRMRTSTSSYSRTGGPPRRGISLTYSRSPNSTRLLDMAAIWCCEAFCGVMFLVGWRSSGAG